MYLVIIRQEVRISSNDWIIAKRMGILIGTDVICWLPILVFGMSALCGHPWISLSASKYLLVLFYPINACVNPLLYAFLTKPFLRDFFILTSRYGLCLERAAKYKGTSSGLQNHHRFGSRNPHHHRHREYS